MEIIKILEKKINKYDIARCSECGEYNLQTDIKEDCCIYCEE